MGEGKTVVIIGTLDTKGDETLYVKKLLERRGLRTLVVDTGVRGEPLFAPEVRRERVAAAVGSDLHELAAARDRAGAVEVMGAGAAVIISELYAQGELDGIIGLGGGCGSTIAGAAMRALPIGIPKVLVTAKGNGDYRAYVGRKDIAIVYSVTDIMGLNPVLRRVLSNAVGAISGMVEQDSVDASVRPTVALTSFGATTPAARQCRALLVDKGYEVLVFSADGAGGQNLEDLIAQNAVDAVLDLTTSELSDELCGGTASAGPHRLESAARCGVPQVVVPGAIDFVNFNPPEAVPSKYAGRQFYNHTPSTVLMRTTAEENAILGRSVGERVGKSSGPAAILLPLQGFSEYDCKGRVFYNTEADRAFIQAVHAGAGTCVPVVEADVHINDPTFASTAVDLLLQLVNEKKRSTKGG